MNLKEQQELEIAWLTERLAEMDSNHDLVRAARTGQTERTPERLIAALNAFAPKGFYFGIYPDPRVPEDEEISAGETRTPEYGFWPSFMCSFFNPELEDDWRKIDPSSYSER